jgi:hypothetical protein
MAQLRGLAQDSVCKLVQNGDLAKTLNTLRTVQGAKNPFVASRPGTSSNGSSNTSTSTGVQTGRK